MRLKIQNTNQNIILCVFLFLFLNSCVSKKLSDFIQPTDIKENDEYENYVKISEIEPPVEVKIKEEKKEIVEEIKKLKRIKKPVKISKKPKYKIKKKKPKPEKEKLIVKTEKKVNESKHLPDLEDPEGFVKRRPVVDPFVPGESTVLSLTYMGMDAGYLGLEVKPYVEVNGEKAYKFFVTIKSSKLFSYVYSLDNSAETYVSYNEMIPFSHEVHFNESKQIKETRSFFDWQNLKAHFWEKKVTKEHGEEKRKIEWDIKKYSHNVISALFYMRTFAYRKGKYYSFRVADDGKNIVFKAKVVKRERIKTDVGTFNTVVIQPTFEVNGNFEQTGKILFWLTDDERRFLVKIKSKIKIGSLYGELKSLKKQ